MKLQGCLLASLLMLSMSTLAARPNIVLLIGDDVGFSDVGVYGSEIETPNLDALAAQGTIFSNYHTTASCSPTRSMLMTGVDNHLNGLGNMAIVAPYEHKGQPGYEGVLNDRVVTVAEMLRNNGYHTYHVGKWHLGIDPDKRPFNRGFERTIALGDTGADNWEQRSYLPIYDKAHWYADGVEHQLPDDFYSSRYFVDKTIEFIDSHHGDGKPFFAYVGFQAVHIPLQAPAEFVDKYVDTYQQGWTELRRQRRDQAAARGLIPADANYVEMSSTEDWDALDAAQQAYHAQVMAVYAGMMDAMDHHIGRLVAHLKQIGEYDNTVFIFLSDNGAEPSDPLANRGMEFWVNQNFSTALEDLGAKGAYAALGPSWGSAAASPLAYFKFWAGEGGVRVPLIITQPGRLPAGRIEHSFAHVKDIMPTMLELSGTPDHQGRFAGREVEPITGSSLVPVIKQEAERTHPPDKPIGYELAGNAALYKGDYKLVRNLPPLGDGQWYLYDIVRDPGETTDLRDSEPERYVAMQADYAAYEQQNNVLPMPAGYDYMQQTVSYTHRVLLARWWPRFFAVIIVLVLLVALFVELRRSWSSRLGKSR